MKLVLTFVQERLHKANLKTFEHLWPLCYDAALHACLKCLRLKLRFISTHRSSSPSALQGVQAGAPSSFYDLHFILCQS